MRLVICFFFYSYADLTDLHSFPTRRSSDLEEWLRDLVHAVERRGALHPGAQRRIALVTVFDAAQILAEPGRVLEERDRKSTRLNSSHTVISYAVFCLKKKNVEQVATMLFIA